MAQIETRKIVEAQNIPFAAAPEALIARHRSERQSRPFGLASRFIKEEEVEEEVLRLSQGSTEEEYAETLATAVRIHREQKDPPQITGDGFAFAFLVHPRDLEENGPRDLPNLLPAFRGASIKEACIFFERLGPGTICPYTSNPEGKEVIGALSYVPITIPGLEERDYFAGDRNEVTKEYVRPRILEAVEHSIRMGAKIVGLGEMLSAMTHHGRYIEDALIRRLSEEEAKKITILTGHDMTIVLMIETMKRMAEEITGKELTEVLNEEALGIFGCGSIGDSFVRAIMAAEHNLKKVVLYDTQQDVAERLAKKLRENVGNQNPNIEILVKQEPEEAFGEARIWVTTAGVPKPVIINPDCLLRGTFGVDDGQPHNVSPEVAHSQNTAFCEPLAKPIAYRTFPTGLVQKGGVDAASYGCETQAVVAQRLKRMGVNLADCLSMGPGKVTPERVKEIYQLIEKSGIDLQLAPLQSHGRLLTPEHFKTVARHWQQ